MHMSKQPSSALHSPFRRPWRDGLLTGIEEGEGAPTDCQAVLAPVRALHGVRAAAWRSAGEPPGSRVTSHRRALPHRSYDYMPGQV